MQYFGKNGTYKLADQPMKSGGEGAIHLVEGRNDLVAKIYFKSAISEELPNKLTYMTNNPPDRSILSQIAWPQDILRDSAGNFIGFVMPKLAIDTDLKDIYVYPPKNGLSITYEQKVIIAINICIVISAIHKAGYTFGDFNPMNIGVNLKTGHVAFLDTDSYHVYDRENRKLYRCGVCLNGYVAPELIQQCKGTDYLNAPLPTFTQETDKFALAIHIFKLLMNGYTPFNGIKETDTVSSASPGIGNKAIEKDNYCFKPGNKPQSVATPDLSAFPPDIQYLFKRAFIDGRNNTEMRPSADDWYQALCDYKKNLTCCNRDASHYYYVNNRSCPYCEAEDRYNQSMGKSTSQMSFSSPVSVPTAPKRSTYTPTSTSSPTTTGTSTYVGSSARTSTTSGKKTGNFTKKAIKTIVVLAVLGALFAFLIWPKIIFPLLSNDNLHTPEIIQSYCYSSGKKDVILTITECSEDGAVKATWEFIDDGKYGKVNLTGKIVKKKNNGNVEIEWTSNSVEMMPEGITWDDEKTLSIKKEWTVVKTDTLTLNAGTNDEYTIDAVEDLQKLSGSEGTYYLKSDIDMAGTNWTPIEGFTGLLLGNGHTIRNLKIESSGSNIGFFSTLNGIVMNLNFENASVTVSGRQENAGILCGKLESGKIGNISASGKVTADTSTNVGGIVGNIAVTEAASFNDLKNAAEVTGLDNVGGIIGCMYNISTSHSTIDLSGFENTGSITGNGSYVGGIVGYSKQSAKYGASFTLNGIELKNTGTVTGKTHVGGIFGYAETNSSDSLLQDCTNNSAITGECYVGCIGGQLSFLTISACKNTGSSVNATGYETVDGEKYAYVGGFVGFGYLANNCTNEVEINYTDSGRYVGGIIGYTNASGPYTMTGLKNTANIAGNSYVGGIIGCVYNESSSRNTVDLSGFENTGSITGNGSYVGGIVGYSKQFAKYGASSTLNGIELKNTGTVTGKTHVGGIFGYAETNGSDSLLQDCTNNSAITGECYVGCIGGQLNYLQISDCSNAGSSLTATGYDTIDGEKYAYVGGFVGFGYLANNCTNEVEINYTDSGRYVGGIMGYTNASGPYTMTGLKNTANIAGNSYVGGIIGCVYNENSSRNTVNLSGFENTGAITGNGSYVGGIIGHSKQFAKYGDSSTLYVTDFVNSGEVHGYSYTGGLFGYAETNSTDSTISDSTDSTGRIAGELKNVTVK